MNVDFESMSLTFTSEIRILSRKHGPLRIAQLIEHIFMISIM